MHASKQYMQSIKKTCPHQLECGLTAVLKVLVLLNKIKENTKYPELMKAAACKCYGVSIIRSLKDFWQEVV